MKKMIVTLLFVLCGTMTACIEDGAPLPAEETPPDATPPTTPDATVPPTPDAGVDCPPDAPPPAPMLTVTANPMTITSGESTTVSWTSTNTEKCWSKDGDQTVDQPTEGEWPDLYPTMTTTYTLICKGPGGEVEGSVEVAVKPLVTMSMVIGSGMTEGQTGYFVIKRVGGNTYLPLTVYFTVSGSAQSGTDYQVMPASVTISAYANSEFVPVHTIDDQIVENNEYVVLGLTSDSSYTLGSTTYGTMLVVDNDDPPPPPTLSLTATPTTITSGNSSTLSWSSTYASNCTASNGWTGTKPVNGTLVVSPTTTKSYGLTCSGSGGDVYKSVTVTVNPPPPQCSYNEDCNDGYSWTGDSCNTTTGMCVHWATDCGGMQIRPANNTADCQFWSGFGTPEPAPSLGKYSPSSLSTGPSGGNWKAAPAHACSVICYNPGSDVETTVDIQIEWNGTSLQHQEITGLKKGTWDGKNLRY